SVEIRDAVRFRDAYDENTMGVWDVRVVQQDARNGDEPVTDWKRTVDGVADFDIELGGLESRSIRFVAQARLISPIEGYECIEESQRPLFFAVLLGGEIDAEVATRKLSG